MPKPSAEQQEAVEHRGRFVLRACPGSGKTFTVAHRLAKRLSEWEHPHAGIATLSFTNVAHEEISHQLQELGHPAVPSYPHFLGTIDHFVNTWVFLPFGHLVMECQQRPAIVGLYHSVWDPGNEWAWGKTECYKTCHLIDFTYDINGRLTNVKGDRANCPFNKRICSQLKRRFVQRGYANQSDANYWAMKVLEEYPQVARSLTRRFPEMIIDEAQDTSDIQMRIVDLLVEQGLAEIMLVGDPDQAIYEWRDAKPEVFRRKISAEGWETLCLTENRRSSQHICNATRGFSTLVNASKAVGDANDFSVLPCIVEYDTTDEGYLKDWLITFCQKHCITPNPDDVAILVRGRALLRRIVGLGKEVNPWNHGVTRLLAQAGHCRDNGDIKQAMSYLRSAVSRICFGDRSYTRTEVAEQVAETMGTRDWQIGLWQLLRLLPVSDMRLADWVRESKSRFEKWFAESNWPIVDPDSFSLAAKQWIGKGGKRSTDFLGWPVSSFLTESSYAGQITVGTIHSAKGKTYEAVLFVVTSRGKCTTKQLAERPLDDEEIRTAYVAITRPRKVLVVAVPKGTDPKRLHRFPKWMVTGQSLRGSES